MKLQIENNNKVLRANLSFWEHFHPASSVPIESHRSLPPNPVPHDIINKAAGIEKLQSSPGFMLPYTPSVTASPTSTGRVLETTTQPTTPRSVYHFEVVTTAPQTQHDQMETYRSYTSTKPPAFPHSDLIVVESSEMGSQTTSPWDYLSPTPTSSSVSSDSVPIAHPTSLLRDSPDVEATNHDDSKLGTSQLNSVLINTFTLPTLSLNRNSSEQTDYPDIEKNSEYQLIGKNETVKLVSKAPENSPEVIATEILTATGLEQSLNATENKATDPSIRPSSSTSFPKEIRSQTSSSATSLENITVQNIPTHFLSKESKYHNTDSVEEPQDTRTVNINSITISPNISNTTVSTTPYTSDISAVASELSITETTKFELNLNTMELNLNTMIATDSSVIPTTSSNEVLSAGNNFSTNESAVSNAPFNSSISVFLSATDNSHRNTQVDDVNSDVSRISEEDVTVMSYVGSWEYGSSTIIPDYDYNSYYDSTDIDSITTTKVPSFQVLADVIDVHSSSSLSLNSGLNFDSTESTDLDVTINPIVNSSVEDFNHLKNDNFSTPTSVILSGLTDISPTEISVPLNVTDIHVTKPFNDVSNTEYPQIDVTDELDFGGNINGSLPLNVTSVNVTAGSISGNNARNYFHSPSANLGLVGIFCGTSLLVVFFLLCLGLVMRRRYTSSRKVYVTPARLGVREQMLDDNIPPPDFVLGGHSSFSEYDFALPKKTYLTKPLPPAILPREFKYDGNQSTVEYSLDFLRCTQNFPLRRISSCSTRRSSPYTENSKLSSQNSNKSSPMTTERSASVDNVLRLYNEIKRPMSKPSVGSVGSLELTVSSSSLSAGSKNLAYGSRNGALTPPSSSKDSISATSSENDDDAGCHSNKLCIEAEVHVDSGKSIKISQDSSVENIPESSPSATPIHISNKICSYRTPQVLHSTVGSFPTPPLSPAVYSSHGTQLVFLTPNSLHPKVHPPSFAGDSSA